MKPKESIVKVATSEAKHSNVVVSFADSVAEHGVVSAGRIFDDLIGSKLWFLPRLPKALQPNSTVLFYQSGAGLRGYAVVNEIGVVTAKDRSLLSHYGLTHLSVRISLEAVVVFNTPLNLRPLLSRLDFITNKKYWGHNLRIPTAISKKDFALILKSAALPINEAAGDSAPNTRRKPSTEK